MDIKKEKTLAFGAGAVLVCFFAGFMYMVVSNNEDNKEQQALNSGVSIEFNTNKTTQIEYGSDVKAIDLIKNHEGELKCPKLDTKKLGKKTLKYTAGVDGYKKTYKKKINVVDTVSPTIKLDINSKQTIEQGTQFDFNTDMVHCSDPVDGEITPEISGTIDTSKVGTQKLTIRATDVNGNTTKKTVTVDVVAPETSKASLDVSVGDALDSWSQYNSSYILVRNHAVYLQGNVSQEAIDKYVKEINICPQYLLDMVDKIVIASQDVMESEYQANNTDTDTVVGHTQYIDGNAIVILNATNTGDTDDVFIHEAVHAYDAKANISKIKQFKSIYKKEKNSASKYADKNESEFFAYTYTEYVTKGKDELKKTCPKVAEFYEKMSI